VQWYIQHANRFSFHPSNSLFFCRASGPGGDWRIFGLRDFRVSVIRDPSVRPSVRPFWTLFVCKVTLLTGLKYPVDTNVSSISGAVGLSSLSLPLPLSLSRSDAFVRRGSRMSCAGCCAYMYLYAELALLDGK
jgi:hypothetical protein